MSLKTVFNPFTGKLDFVGSAGNPAVLTLGSPTQDGSWRIAIFGSNLLFLHRESGVWVEQGAMLGSPPTSSYSFTNLTTDKVIDVSLTSVDELADVTGSLILDLQSGNNSSLYTALNVTTDRSFDADNTSLDELANVIGTLISDLQAVPSSAVYTTSNITITRTMDADSTSLDELADVIGTFIQDLQAGGLLQ